MEEVNMVKARRVYDTFCRMLDNGDWHYTKEEDDLVIRISVSGDDLPINLIIKVNPEKQVVSIYSIFDFSISEEKRIDMAVAVSVANYGLVSGSFDYDITDGSLLFRLSESYIDSELGEGLFEYMLLVSAGTVDQYNDKFFMISKGVLSIQDFIKAENQ